MRPVYAIASNITTSIGLSATTAWQQAIAGNTGIREYTNPSLSKQPFWASMLAPDQWQQIEAAVPDEGLSPFERMAVYAAKDALANAGSSIDLANTVLILSSTKGNIEWLGQEPDERLLLSTSASLISRALGLAAMPVVVSHACVSGVIALQYGERLLAAGRYKYALVLGADRFTRFVLSGFQSFQAVADGPCRPFDVARKGINLGEAAAAILLSADPADEGAPRLAGGATSNDANHISGPSRTGAELAMAIGRAMSTAAVQPAQIDMISAHGTATLYNDEMESRAFAHAGLLRAAVHSMKGFTGHTLGAAGVLECAMILESMKQQMLIPSAGYSDPGTPEILHITTIAQAAPVRHVLKTASGFGGCNAAIVWSL